MRHFSPYERDASADVAAPDEAHRVDCVFGHASVAAYGFHGFIFRHVSLPGERYHHGYVIHFVWKLRADSNKIQILGNGLQRKSYLYIQDCIDAMLMAVEKAPEGVNIYNLGREELCTVMDSVNWICKRFGLNRKWECETEKRGWMDDNPLVLLDGARIKALGWKPRVSIEEGVKRTVDYLTPHFWELNAAR